MNKAILRFILFLLFLLLAGEFSLRYVLGFCNAPIYESNKLYEYIPKPNQSGYRFGNFYYYNSFSQRSREPDSSKITILGLGDSVIHGGVQSDQDSIATTIFTQDVKKCQMLNISAGSWGPDNCAAYLGENGTFDAKLFFLVVSSHDAYDNMDFKPVVGNHPSYPAEQYTLAWTELIDRYLFPKISKYYTDNAELDPDQKVLKEIGLDNGKKMFNPGFTYLKSISDSLDIPLLIYLHADKVELHNGKYNKQGQEIINWVNKNNLTLIRELDYHFNENDYRDKIHLNEKGQKKLAMIMKQTIVDQL